MQRCRLEVDACMGRFFRRAVFAFVAAIPIVGLLAARPDELLFGDLCLALPMSLGVGLVGWTVDWLVSEERKDSRPPRTF